MISVNSIKALYQKDGFKKYFKNTSWLFLERGLRMIIGLTVGIWVARHLGPADYGAYQYAISYVSIFTAIATLGIDQIVIRELVVDESRRNKLMGTSFTLKLIGSFISVILILISLPFFESEEVVVKMILIIGCNTIFLSFNVIDFYFQSKVLSQYAVYSNIISLFLSSLAKVYLIFTNADLVYFAWVFVLETVVLIMGFAYFYLKIDRDNSMRKWKFDASIAKSLLKDSWPLLFGGMVLMIQARIDQVMLKRFIGNEEVGYYSVALRIIEILSFIPALLQSSLLPSLINSKKVSEKFYQNRLLNYYRLNFLFFVITAAPIFLFSEFIIINLYTASYAPAIPLLALMTARMALANMGVARSSFINIENLFKFSMITMIIGTVINVLLNYYLIPISKSTGAIWATIVSFTVTTFIVDLFYSKTRGNALLQIKSMITFYLLRVDFLKEKNEETD